MAPIDLTQRCGFIAFLAGALACAAAATGACGRRVWWSLAALQVAYAVEVAAGVRYRARDLAAALLASGGWYEQRSGLQFALIVVALVVTAWSLRRLGRAAGTQANAGIAVAAGASTLFCFLLEAISLHRLDALMYAQVGPVKLVGWVWAIASCLVCAAAVRTMVGTGRQRPG